MRTALLPEVRAVDASPEIRAVYDDICSVMDVPFVNLIHRYLATIPGALEYAWSLGRQACLDGRLDSQVVTLTASAKTEEIAQPGASSLPSDARQAVLRIVNVYNRQNPRNIIIFNALLAVLRNSDVSASDDPVAHFPSHEGRVSSIIPELPKFNDLDEHTQELLLELSALQELSGRRLVPSLYLHLATIPGAVEDAYDAIVHPLREGIIAKHVQFVRARATSLGAELVPTRHALPRALYDRRNEIADVVASFTERAIPSMVVIGDMLACLFTSNINSA